MNPTQRERIKKQQRQLKRAAARKQAREAQLAKKQQQQVRQKRVKPRKAQQLTVSHPLPIPEDIKADDFNKECYIIGGGPSLIGFDWSKLDGKFVRPV